MASLAREAIALQNPAFGSIILWKFTTEYFDTNPVHAGAPLLLAFLVLPMILHEGTRKQILSTNPTSGLRFFADKFTAPSLCQTDFIATLERRITVTKQLTLDSVRIMLGCGMGILDVDSASLFPAKRHGLSSKIPPDMEPFTKAAKKLGHWTSPLSLFEISTILGVAF